MPTHLRFIVVLMSLALPLGTSGENLRIDPRRLLGPLQISNEERDWR
jgi:hypothetical protein